MLKIAQDSKTEDMGPMGEGGGLLKVGGLYVLLSLFTYLSILAEDPLNVWLPCTDLNCRIKIG